MEWQQVMNEVPNPVVHVLLVEDDPDQAAVMEATIRSIPGFHLDHAGTLGEALYVADRFAIDIVLLDLDLPDSPVGETVERFCSARPDVAVVVLTGQAGKGRPEHALRFGAQDYLNKGPIAPDVLSRVIRYSIERKAVERQLRASERKNREFAADVAHELRTPLTILKYQVDDVGKSAEAKAMHESIDRMARLVEQILAHAEADHLPVSDVRTLNLANIARDVATDLVPLALKMGRLVAFDGPDTSVCVPGNEEGVRRAIRNLIENALKYSDAGTTVEVGVGKAGTVAIKDSGAGIPPEKRELIFKRFLRADRRPTGTGLGLSIVKKIMDAHGGSIEISDADGGGAIFTLRFPLDTEATVR